MKDYYFFENYSFLPIVKEKDQINSETVSQINLLDKDGRVKELARMLGGVEITETTLEHAKELLS